MFSNKKQAVSRNNRMGLAGNSSQRSKTPSNSRQNKQIAGSLSQAKNNHPEQPPISKQNLLTPISQQIAYERPYYLGKGNNHQLIRRVLNRRKGWGQSISNQFTYLRWVQSSQSFKYHLLGKEVYCFNHFEYQRQLSNKQRLVNNLVNFCESNKINAYNFIPITYIIDLTTGEEDLILHAFLKFYNRNHPDNDERRYNSIILPRIKYVPYYSAQQLNKRSQGNFYCKPYFPKTFNDPQTKPYIWILKPTVLNRGRGVALFRSLQELQKLIWKYYEGQGLNQYQGESLSQFDSVIQKKQQKQEKVQQQQAMKQEGKDEKKQEDRDQNEKVEDNPKEEQHKLSKSEPIIRVQSTKQAVTPKKQAQIRQKSQKSSGQNSKEKKQKSSSQKNIHTKQQQVTNTQSTIKGNGNNAPVFRCSTFIIQKYIEQPMLIDHKKFDIRIWVLLTHTLEVYIFEEGYLRFSSYQYSTKSNHNNPFIHLTNNSVQKYSNEYDKFTGNQIALSEIVKYIEPKNKAESIYTSIVKKIKDIVWLSMCSVRRKINVNSRKVCFELFGYDFMIDKDYKVWLIEVNTNPALEESGPLLKQILPRMIDDMFKLTIDKIFNNQQKEDQEDLSVDGHDINKNMFEFIGDLREGNTEKNSRRLTFARR